MKKEIYKPIPDFEGYYEISNYGNVRSVERYINVNANGKKPYTRIKRAFVLKPVDTKKIIVVKLTINGLQKDITVSKTVRKVFGDGAIYSEHIDGNYKNNYIDNLK